MPFGVKENKTHQRESFKELNICETLLNIHMKLLIVRAFIQ